MHKVIDIDEVREYLSHCGEETKVYLGADSERFLKFKSVSFPAITLTISALSQ